MTVRRYDTISAGVDVDKFIGSMLDLIFKNQAMATRDKPQGQFVNDLLRTEFHKYAPSLAPLIVH
jgi:hypothetical protein